jgi:hypothetical protein
LIHQKPCSKKGQALSQVNVEKLIPFY